MSRRKEPSIPNELLDQLLAGGAASAVFEQGGLLDTLKKAFTGNCSRGWQKKSCAETRDLIHPTDVERTWHWAE